MTCKGYYSPYSLSQAHYRRGESFKIILNMPQLQNSIQAMCGILPNGSGSASEDAFSQVIADLLKCIQLQSVPDPKIFSEIIVLAVKYSTLNCGFRGTSLYCFSFVPNLGNNNSSPGWPLLRGCFVHIVKLFVLLILHCI